MLLHRGVPQDTSGMNESVTVAADAPRYDFRAAEPRWQRAWAERGCFRVDDVPTDNKPKYYVMEMFPYPSGKIHMGHVRNYTLGDVVARYKRARGFSVLHPMGWDAFGLPAENAARERGIHPAKWTWENIANMRAELQRMGLSLEWEREFATCDPAYYGHQQKLFLDFLRAGLVERKESWVNWDPVDGTVLANEQVIDGRGWRSGAPVEKKQLSQWFFKITDYARNCWTRSTRSIAGRSACALMQAKWIGRSEGARLNFALAEPIDEIVEGEVYTTRPDTLFGMSFLALAPEHPLAAAVAAHDPEAAAVHCRMPPDGHVGGSDRDRGKARLRHRSAGAASVPEGHDLPGMDRQFRADGIRHRRHLRMPCARSARPGLRAQIRAERAAGRPAARRRPGNFDVGNEAYVGPGTIFNSDFLDGLDVDAAKRAVIERTGASWRRPRRG